MNTKKILIGGCSFSQYTRDNFEEQNLTSGWISWTDFLKKDYSSTFKIINRAQGSFGQSRIVESLLEELIKYNFEVDYVIIQWSAVGRAYSVNQNEFFNKMINQYEVPFSPHAHEYMINDDKQGWVTNLTKEIETSFYRASLNQIFLMKSLLEYRLIPYKMFWGWEQITPEIEKDTKDLLNVIYNDSFWRHGKHGGMSELILENMSETDGLIGNGDFHPSTKGQEFFYNTIIKDIIKQI